MVFIIIKENILFMSFFSTMLHPPFQESKTLYPASSFHNMLQAIQPSHFLEHRLFHKRKTFTQS